jgi:hypothetical protein
MNERNAYGLDGKDKTDWKAGIPAIQKDANSMAGNHPEISTKTEAERSGIPF